MSARDEQRQNNLGYIYIFTDTQCVQLLRVRRAPFCKLCDLFCAKELLKDTIHCTIEEQVAMFLHVVGHNQMFTCINLSFRRSTETISRHFKEVLYAVRELRNKMIVPAFFSNSC
jgi:predicted chitinase